MKRVLLYFALALAAAPLFTPLSANALDASGFKPGKIIDDGVFTNNRSMTTDQIQAFLNSKMPTCDSSGSKTSEYGGGTRAQYAQSRGYALPLVCLKDYTENGLSAATIINNVAQQYRINPQVLIVLLQKEQGLVTDDWPLPSQYRTATGYGCPDTAPCDAQYYGLTNQLTWAAKMFRAIMDARPDWYTPYVLGDNYIGYSPNSSCGGTTVTIQNRATQALYNYTPYQPNQAALAAVWGSAPCGAYGNRNFYLYFTQWFGSTYKPTLAECPTTQFKCVWGFIDDSSGQYFYTTSVDERNAVYQMNYTSIGIVFLARPESTPNAVPVYRLYGSDGSHIWTADQQERDALIATKSWSSEGTGFYMDPVNSNTGYPVSRLYNQVGRGVHMFSIDSARNTILVNAGYKNEGALFSTPSLNSPAPVSTTGSQYVYRFQLKDEHFWTTSIAERDGLIARGASYEGPAFTATVDSSLPVYRLYAPNGTHFWTTSDSEKTALTSIGYRLEGTAWQAKNTGQPVYRLYDRKTGDHLWTVSTDEKAQILKQTSWLDEGTAWYQ